MKIRRSLLLGSAFVATVSAAATLALAQSGTIQLIEPSAPNSSGAVSCGAMCGDVWHHVVNCADAAACCGYINCNSGSSQGKCCYEPLSCDWDAIYQSPPIVRCK